MPNSPATYFAHARIPSITSSVQRIGSSSRPVARQSDIDFDVIPSPRNASLALSRRSSTINGISAGPSHLSYSVANFNDDSSDAGGFDEPFGAGYDPQLPPSSEPESDHETTPVPQRKKSIDMRRPSFAKIGQDEEEGANQDEDMIREEEEEVERHMRGKKSKGKSRQTVDEDEGLPMEDDIAEGLEEVDNQPEEEIEQETSEQPRNKAKDRQREDDGTEKQRPKKKVRVENTEEGEKSKKPKGRARKENILREGKIG